jgi:hypothetical protein
MVLMCWILGHDVSFVVRKRGSGVCCGMKSRECRILGHDVSFAV